MKKLQVLCLIWITIFIFSCNPDGDYAFNEESIDKSILSSELKQVILSESESIESYILPDENEFSAIPQDPKNPITREKVELGKLLFHETGLATNSSFENSMFTFSCASCHHAEAGFQANLPQGIGDGGIGFGEAGEGRFFNPMCNKSDIDVQPVRTPSALNIAYQTNVLWNGQFGATYVNEGTEDAWVYDTPKEANQLGYQGAETQAIAGLDVHRFGLSITDSFIESTVYKELFTIAFPDEPENFIYSAEAAGLAIAAYERTLLANQSKWQQWLNGDEDVMSIKELEGGIAFFKYNCNTCHNGPALNSMEFHAFGLNDLSNSLDVINVTAENSEHLGRGGFTGNQLDNYKFKVPQLYNLKDSKFYGHGSSLTSVKDVIEYKNNGIAENNNVPHTQLSSTFKPLGMTQYEIEALTYFIEESLYDPNLTRYEPSALPTGHCFPNNDALSKVDLGCL